MWLLLQQGIFGVKTALNKISEVTCHSISSSNANSKKIGSGGMNFSGFVAPGKLGAVQPSPLIKKLATMDQGSENLFSRVRLR